MLIKYNFNYWKEVKAIPVDTLQVFITNECNLRCKSCFYKHGLGKEYIPLEKYKKIISNYPNIKKINLLGGEPTLHPDLDGIIKINNNMNFKTTIYTNGQKMKKLENINLENTTVRVGVHGLRSSEKPLSKIPRTIFPITILYMLDSYNVNELKESVEIAERLNCKKFFISSIRDIGNTGNYWIDNENTIPLSDYASIVQEFVSSYKGNIEELHISNRGVIFGRKNVEKIQKCRFGNIFPDGKKIICPFDISLQKYVEKLDFEKKCDKNDSCLLTKLILRRKN